MDLKRLYVIAVCDKAKERCLFLPSKSQKFHHIFPDPAKAKGIEAEIMQQFREVRKMIKKFSQHFIAENVRSANTYTYPGVVILWFLL